MKARTDAVGSLMMMVTSALVLGFMLLLMGPITDSIIQQAQVNSAFSPTTVNVLVPLQNAMGMMRYVVIGMFILIIGMAIVRAKQSTDDTAIMTTTPREDPRRFIQPQETYQPQDTQPEAQAPEEDQSEKKPEKRDRYRAVKV